MLSTYVSVTGRRGETQKLGRGLCHEDPQQVGDAQKGRGKRVPRAQKVRYG